MSIWSASLEAAERWYGYSWWGLIVCGTIATLATMATVMFTFIQFWSSGVRDKHADLRIAGLEAQTTASRADIASANARAVEAQLALERYKAPRKINGPAFLAALAGKPKAPVEIVFVRDNPECWQLAMQIRDWLKEAKWDYSEPAAIAGPDESRFATYPSAMQAGGQPSGVVIVQRAITQVDFERERDDPFDSDAPIDTPRKALSRALMDSLGSIGGSMGFETGTVGKLRVVVGPKN